MANRNNNLKGKGAYAVFLRKPAVALPAEPEEVMPVIQFTVVILEGR